jgi:hypothetical protein
VVTASAADGLDGAAPPRPNGDVAWDDFDTASYVADNYATLHDLDRRIIADLSPYYRALPPGSLRSSLDIGTGPNIYPLMLVAAASRRLEALERSASNVGYLRRARCEGADPCWTPFWQLCKQLDPALPEDLDEVLRGLTIHHGDALDGPLGQHDLVSMFFVAESVTGDGAEFEQLSHRFAAAAVPGGHLVAAYMAGMPKYELGGETLPAFPLDRQTLEAVMRPVTRELRIRQLPADRTLPYEHEGVLLLTARAPDGPHSVPT